jgi:co-chaperonin GroES (HSP10)
MKALKNRVIVKILQAEQETVVNGIIIPEGEGVNRVNKDVRTGLVLSSGAPDVVDGERIIYSRFSGRPIDEETIMLDIDDILGVIE